MIIPASARISRFQMQLTELPANVRGAIWMLIGSLLFSIMGLGVKYVGAHLDSFQIGFFRAFFGLVAILPFVLYKGILTVRTARLKLHLLRTFVGVTAMLSAYYAITHMPLADAVALSFTRPLFLIILAVLFLGEIVRWRRWSATFIGFVGVIIMLQANAEVGFASAVGLFSAFMVALVSVLLKKLTTTEDPVTIMFYFGLFGTLITAVPAGFVWLEPTLEDILVLLGASLVGAGGNFCMIRALKVGEATAVTPFDYTRLIFSGIFAYLLFAEVPTLMMVVGALIIVSSSLYILNREARIKARKLAEKAPVES
ncbi:DMT family transporter [Sneathiella glossodoripedis]|uniref:DMT family transporter n=1 Tax=Sneathiella glossodoripedis TaxID=418853 RepID=UPI00046EA8C9|nr:DMT family transporter [Sneathiella glossodoripedis]